MSNKNLPPERTNLSDFFKHFPQAQFVVPVYQRNYIWSANKQISKFLSDYDKVLNGSKQSHFLGIIIFLKIEKTMWFNELSIVDGQQRIITSFLMLHAIKDIAIEAGDLEFADNLESNYLVNTGVIEEYQKLKLKPEIASDNTYTKIAKGEFIKDNFTKTEKSSNVYKNYKYIRDYLKGQYGSHSLEDFLDALSKMSTVIIPLESEDNAQEIFETINSTGAELTCTDLIRNYILMNIESSKQEELYNNYWKPFEKLFEQSGKSSNFFRMFLASQTYELTNMEDIYTDFQNWFDNQRHLGKSREDLLAQILKYAQNYVILYTDAPPINSTPALCDAIKEFKRVAAEPSAPLILKLYDIYSTQGNCVGKISDEDMIGIFNLFTSYTMRRSLCNFRTGVLTRIIPPMLKDILDSCANDFSKAYNECVRLLVDNNKNKASFMPDDGYMNATLYNENAYALRNYLKVAFEKIESNNNPAKVDFTNLSIEHILPQTPTPEWSREANIQTQEEYNTQVHRIGNLTLATAHDNTIMSNNLFEYKKQILLETSHLKMNQEIINQPVWTISEINARTSALIGMICQLYPYFSYNSPDIEKYRITLDSNGNNVHGYIYLNESVDINMGSIFTCVDESKSQISDLVNNGIIISKGNGFIFEEDYSFESLAKACEFFVGTSAYMWEEWKDATGYPLNYQLKTTIKNRKSSKRN